MQITDKVIRALLSFQRRCWEHGEAMQALYEFGAYDELVVMAKQAIVMSLSDGRVCIQNGDEKALVTDPCCAGEGLLAAWKYTGDIQFKHAFDKLLDYALHHAPRNEDGIVYHVTRAPQFWLDSMYMLPPFLAIAGEYEEAIRQVNGYWDCLYNPEHQLMHWMWDDAEKKVAWPNFRSICNGFAIAGMTRVALALPESMREERDELVHKTMLVVDGMLRVTGEDGYSHCTYGDPATHVAMNGALILAGVLYRLLSKNLIDRGRYLPIANRLRMSFHQRVDEYGFVEDVARRNPYIRSSPNGQSFFLIMEAACRDFEISEKERQEAK